MDAIDLYQAADLEAHIDPNHRGTLEDAYHDLRKDSVPVKTSSTPVTDFPMKISLSKIIAAQRTDQLYQTVFATIGHADSFFFKAEDGVLRFRHPSIPELEQIVVPESLRPRLLHMAHHSKMVGHPGRTRIFANLRLTYYWPLMATNIYSTV